MSADVVNSTKSSKITLTRGDDGLFTIPIYDPSVLDEDGKPTLYAVTDADTVEVHVRTEPIETYDDLDGTLVFEGRITIDEDGIPNWHISHEDSAIDCGTYYWDAQITNANGWVSTYWKGKLIITSEETSK